MSVSFSLTYSDGITALNIIRADQKDFQYTAVKTEVDKASRIVDLYTFAKAFIPSLNLSKNAVRYYADIAEQWVFNNIGIFIMSKKGDRSLFYDI